MLVGQIRSTIPRILLASLKIAEPFDFIDILAIAVKSEVFAATAFTITFALALRVVLLDEEDNLRFHY